MRRSKEDAWLCHWQGRRRARAPDFFYSGLLIGPLHVDGDALTLTRSTSNSHHHYRQDACVLAITALSSASSHRFLSAIFFVPFLDILKNHIQVFGFYHYKNV